MPALQTMRPNRRLRGHQEGITAFEKQRLGCASTAVCAVSVGEPHSPDKLPLWHHSEGLANNSASAFAASSESLGSIMSSWREADTDLRLLRRSSSAPRHSCTGEVSLSGEPCCATAAALPALSIASLPALK